MKKHKALLLFSEGLDSILAGKLLQKQAIEVVALRFITPFFGWSWKGREEEFVLKVAEQFGFKGIVQDITTDFLKVLEAPKHGYGSRINPCIDCRILMLKKAKALLELTRADFLATGEVVGQRPMTQQRHMLRHIEKEAQVEGLVVRPLSARILWETEAERRGLVRKEQFFSWAGRGRKKQIVLARSMGLKEIPSPAGGCLLTDPHIADRIRLYLQHKDIKGLNAPVAELLTFGRHFPLPGAWLVLGRTAEENQRLLRLVTPQDTIIKLKDLPGPTGLILGQASGKVLEEAASLLRRYAPKARHMSGVEVLVISGTSKRSMFRK